MSPSRPPRKPRTTATLTAEQSRLLKAMADGQKVSVSWLIRFAVDRLIEQESKGLQLPLEMPKRANESKADK